MRKGPAFGLTVAGFLGLIFCLLLTVVEFIGTDAGLYHRLQRKNGVTEAIGVSDGDLVRLDGALAHYLKGDEAAMNVEAEVYGERQAAFNEREISHMRDVLGLFVLLRRVRRILLPLGLLLLGAGLWLGREACARRWGRLYGIALLLLALPLAAFAVWAARDFDAAFTAFHHVLFRNDLWLLDPRTDLMIRMLPAGFFADMGLRVVLWSAACLLTGAVAALLAGRALARRAEPERPESRRRPEWK